MRHQHVNLLQPIVPVGTSAPVTHSPSRGRPWPWACRAVAMRPLRPTGHLPRVPGAAASSGLPPRPEHRPGSRAHPAPTCRQAVTVDNVTTPPDRPSGRSCWAMTPPHARSWPQGLYAGGPPMRLGSVRASMDGLTCCRPGGRPRGYPPVPCGTGAADGHRHAGSARLPGGHTSGLGGLIVLVRDNLGDEYLRTKRPSCIDHLASRSTWLLRSIA